jgi:hypothetical protein
MKVVANQPNLGFRKIIKMNWFLLIKIQDQNNFS